MFRLGLVTYLVIAMLAGPALCCCTTARLLASLGPSATKTAQDCSNHTSGCCRHSDPAQKDKAPAEKDHSDGPQCPCKQDGSQPALSPVELDGASALLRTVVSDWFALPLVGDTSGLTLGVLRPAAAGDRWLVPFLSTQDILFGHHMLRC